MYSQLLKALFFVAMIVTMIGQSQAVLGGHRGGIGGIVRDAGNDVDQAAHQAARDVGA